MIVGCAVLSALAKESGFIDESRLDRDARLA